MQHSEGGFCGRTNKSPDACYCFWCGASLKVSIQDFPLRIRILVVCLPGSDRLPSLRGPCNFAFDFVHFRSREEEIEGVYHLPLVGYAPGVLVRVRYVYIHTRTLYTIFPSISSPSVSSLYSVVSYSYLDLMPWPIFGVFFFPLFTLTSHRTWFLNLSLGMSLRPTSHLIPSRLGFASRRNLD